jgi:hypothetical protein
MDFPMTATIDSAWVLLIVYRRLRETLGDCGSIAECRARLLPALDDLARKIATPGTELNRLVTQGE